MASLTEQLDELTDRLDALTGSGWKVGDYGLLLDISDYLRSMDA